MILLFAALGALACGGGGSTPAPGEVTFAVTQVTPLDSSAEVPLSQEINVVFSRPVDPASLTPETLQVVAESGDVVAGQRLVAPLNQAVVRFLPITKYFPFAVHTIRVTRGVRDVEGDALDREYAFHFQTVEAGPVLPDQSDLEDLGALLRLGRWFHRMTLLENDRFLITGGYLSAGVVTDQAENLVVAQRRSFFVPHRMRRARAGHVQVVLPDGRILIAGGEASDTPFLPLKDCEIFNPQGFTFSPVASMHFARSLAAATLLADGRVLVTGGQDRGTNGVVFRDDAEIYDPAADVWTMVAGTMEAGRSGHVAGLLPGGDVVIIGGTPGEASATRWTAGTGTFATGFSPPAFAHYFGAGTLLADGRPFVTGGIGSRGVSIYDPAFGFIGAINLLPEERAFATATPFADGRVLIVGGLDLGHAPVLVHATVDLFFPIGHTGKLFRAVDLELPVPTSHHAAARGPQGAIWITGGLPLDMSLPGSRQVTVIHPASAK